jgi:hypothetical protein
VNKEADLIGKTIRDTGFRGRFDAAVIAVKRNNVKQGGRIGDIVLQKVRAGSAAAGQLPLNTAPVRLVSRSAAPCMWRLCGGISSF